MEGYLYEKRGDAATSSLFSSGKKFKKRWATLQDQILTLHDDFDLKAQKPKGVVKMKLNVANVMTRTYNSFPQEFCFEVLPYSLLTETDEIHADIKQGTVLSAESENDMNMWMECIHDASMGDTLVLSHEQQCQILGLPSHTLEQISEGAATHAFRKFALENHPDHGGDTRLFLRYTQAYETIVRSLDRHHNCEKIDYQAVLVKQGSDLGVHLVEDENTRETFVDAVDENVAVLHEIDDNAGGNIAPDDILTAIRSEPVEHWKWSRIMQRLGDFREPPGSLVTLSFRRFIRHSPHPAVTAGMNMADYALHTLTAEDVRQINGAVASGSDSISSPGGSTKDGNVKIGGEVHESAQSQPLDSKTATPRKSILKKVGNTSPSPTSSENPRAISPTTTLLDKMVPPPPVQFQQSPANNATLTAMQKENAELKMKLQQSGKELHQEKAKVAKLVEVIKGLADELKVKNTALAKVTKQEHFYRAQVEQAIVAGLLDSSQKAKTDETVTEVNKGIIGGASILLSGRPVHPSEQAEQYIKTLGLGENEIKSDTLQSAQRQAMCVVSHIDPSAGTLRLWEAGGNSAAERLLNLEKRIQKAEAGMGYSDVPEGYVLPGTRKEKEVSILGTPAGSGLSSPKGGASQAANRSSTSPDPSGRRLSSKIQQSRREKLGGSPVPLKFSSRT